MPDSQQAGTDFGLAAPGSFVFQHDASNGLARFLAQFDQFVAAGERVRQRGRVCHDAVFGSLVVIDYKAAANGIIVARGQHFAACGVRSETHAVGMERQFLALVEEQIAFFVESNFMLAEQANFFFTANAIQTCRDRLGIDCIRPFAFQPAQHRLVGAVAATGVRQRAEQLGLDARNIFQNVAFIQPARDEARGRAHRSDRMRRRRADADFEQIENADSHGVSESGTGSRYSTPPTLRYAECD